MNNPNNIDTTQDEFEEYVMDHLSESDGLELDYGKVKHFSFKALTELYAERGYDFQFTCDLDTVCITLTKY